MLKTVITFGLVYLFWIIMTFSIVLDELVLGAAVSVVVTYISRKFLFINSKATHMYPHRWLDFLNYFIVFIVEEIISHLDVTYRILTGNINPALVRVDCDIGADIGKAMVANSITLTPGTLTILADKTGFLVHWIAKKEGKNVGERFNEIARRIFSNWEADK